MEILSDKTENIITFRNIPEHSTIVIYSLDGSMFKKITNCGSELEIDMSMLKRGLYLVKSFSADYYLSELIVKE